MSKTVLLQTIQCSSSTLFSPTWLIDSTLSGTTTPGQSGHGNYGNKMELRIPQSSSFTGLIRLGLILWHINHCGLLIQIPFLCI